MSGHVLAQRPETRWRVRPPAPPEAVRQLCRKLEIPPLLASVLYARGLVGDALSSLKPPLGLTAIPDLNKAAERLEQALRQKRRILIHGDYDADGISGTALLTLGLRALGGNVIPYIPNRLTDGYGIHPERVPEHCERAELFLTVDCGISNLEEIARLQDAGVEVIISDHHHPGQRLPDCLIVHPKMSPLAEQGLPELSGAGVAYHLLWALHERLGLEAPLAYSDIASIGTIADVAPLLGENRALVQEGLARLKDSAWPGLRAMIAQSSLRRAPSARDVAFILAPRLNAAGRLGEAELGLELLTTASERRANELAAYLDARNSDRRRIQDEMFEDALKKVDPDAPALVIDDTSWHPGVMGIVASKLLERFYKPVFIIAKGKGSVRSTPGISAVQGLHAAAPSLKRFGGHSQAAGFAIEESKIADFRARIYEYVLEHPRPEPELTADALVSAGELDRGLYKAIQTLEPYGEGHPAPLFVLSDTLDMARAVGKSKATLQLRLAGLKGVAWQKGELAKELQVGQRTSAVISLRENVWQGKTNLEFIAEEVRQAQPLSLGREDANADQIRRGTPQEDAFEPSALNLEDLADLKGQTLWLRSLPLKSETLKPVQPLAALVRSGARLYFDLSEQELCRVESLIGTYPDVLALRRAFVCLQRGQAIPFNGYKEKRAKDALRELDLIDERGHTKRGQKRNPYEAETLLNSLIARYTLQNFVNAYRALDEASFAQSVRLLFMPDKDTS